MAARAYNAVFTAETLEPRTSTRGRPYIHARGVIANATGMVRRTVLVRGPGYADVAARLRVGEPLALRGFYERVRGPGGQGGQFFSAFGLANTRTSSARSTSHPNHETSDDLLEATEQEETLRNVGASPADPMPSAARNQTRIACARSPLDEGPSMPASPVTTRHDRRRHTRRQAVPLSDAAIAMLLAPHERPAMPSVAQLEARAIEQNARQPDLIEATGAGDSDRTDSHEPVRTIGGHLREGYWRRQRHGPGRSLVKTVYIGRSAVNGGPRIEETSHEERANPDMLDLR